MKKRPPFEELEQETEKLHNEISGLKLENEALQITKAVYEKIQIGLQIYRLEDLEDDSSLRMIDANPSASDYTGVLVKHGLGKTLGENLPGLRGKGFTQALADVVRSGESRSLEDVSYGDDRIVESALAIRAFPLPNNCVGVSLENITANKRADEALRETEQKFKKMFERAPLSYQSLDAEGTIIDANETWLQVLGYRKSEVIGKNFSEFLHPDWKQHFAENFPRFKAVGEVLGVEFEMIKKDNESILVSFHGRIGKDQAGNFERTHCVFRDISSQRAAEDQLKEELEINKALAEISKELLSEEYDIKRVSDTTLTFALQITDSRHGFVSAIDRNTLENVGHTLTDMFGKDCLMKDQRIAFPVGEDGRYDALWGHALNTRTPFFTNNPKDHPSRKGLPDGHIPLRNYLAVPVMMGEVLTGMIALANSDLDYTENDIRCIERLAEVYALALHRHQYETDRQRMENQVRQLQKMEAIGTLAGGIAHDFNNILTPFIIHTELAMMDIPDGYPIQNNLKEALKAGLRARDLVKQILTFSRQTDYVVAPIRTTQIAKEALKLLRASIPTTIDIRQTMTAKKDTILANPTQIHQIIMNLCTNAAHAMSEKGGVLEVEISNETIDIDITGKGLELMPGAYVKLMVRDTGMGMSPSTLGRIFDPYFTTKDKEHGTGLGLSVVHGIVKTLKGAITAESKQGEGTTFTVHLPLAKDADQDGKEPAFTDDLPRGNERVLLVDDEKAMVDAVQPMLESLGYEVTGRTGSIEALKAFRHSPREFDLVITDQTMPKMTGIDLARELMAIRPDIPVILCTGFSEAVDEGMAKAMGIRAYVMKPILMNEIAVTVRKVLDPTPQDN